MNKSSQNFVDDAIAAVASVVVVSVVVVVVVVVVFIQIQGTRHYLQHSKAKPERFDVIASSFSFPLQIHF